MSPSVNNTAMHHQYIDRQSGAVHTERLYADGIISLIYSHARERSPQLFRALTSSRASRLLGYLNYDLPIGSRLSGNLRFLRRLGINLDECLDDTRSLNTARKVFERRIRYWECRPMPEDDAVVISPADAKALVGSLVDCSALYIKDKFFAYEELIGCHKPQWLRAFDGGDFAIFRLTPEKYHYNHTPVAGRVVDFYDVTGAYHSCNPQAVVELVSPYSKNKRYVTINDTDVPHGTGVGLVAMIEVVALMIGEVVQTYSDSRYDTPRPIETGMYLCRGMPKSLYRPGSSTDVVLFQKGRIEFDDDIVANMRRLDVVSRFSRGFGVSLVETDLSVRSSIARRREGFEAQAYSQISQAR